jgi:hypothetical protein
MPCHAMKMYLYLTKHHAMKMYGRVEVYLHAFLTLTQDTSGQLHALTLTSNKRIQCMEKLKKAV